MSATKLGFGVLRWMIGCALAVSGTAYAVVDQSQNALDVSLGSAEIGGAFEQKLAQTLTAGLDGPLAALQMPVRCSSGTLIVEIVELDGELPGTSVLASAAVAAADLPHTDLTAFRTIDFERPHHRQSAGDRYAIVLRNPTGECNLTSAPPGDTYLSGDSYFDARPELPGWRSPRDFPGAAFDLAFRTLVTRSGGGGNDACVVHGMALPFSRFTPVCRCLSDAGLREFRCALLHPGIFAFRELPLPVAPGKAFEVEWTVMPLVPLSGPVEITDQWPAGFASSLQGPLVFPGQAMKVGESQTLSYQVLATQKQGRYKLPSEIQLPFGPEPGTMRTVVEVGQGKKKP